MRGRKKAEKRGEPNSNGRDREDRNGCNYLQPNALAIGNIETALPDELLCLVLSFVPRSFPSIAARTCRRWFGCSASSCNNGNKRLHLSAVCSSVSLLRWAHEQQGMGWHPRVCQALAAQSHGGEALAGLRYARKRGCPWDKSRMCFAAVSKGGGSVEVLRWLRKKGCPWDGWTCHAAAGNGHLEALQWARKKGCPWNALTCAEAAGAGQLEVLKWARLEGGCEWDERACSEAARSGHLEVLQWLRQQGCPWNEWTMREAAAGGHLALARWAREAGCPWDAMTVMEAEVRGHKEFAEWARATNIEEDAASSP
ncbi:Ankyrin repeat domain-containing protein [Balamuthia mandrillaris]